MHKFYNLQKMEKFLEKAQFAKTHTKINMHTEQAYIYQKMESIISNFPKNKELEPVKFNG